jgi:hypothetical protein
MANKDAPFGFIPVRMLGGAYFSGGQDEYDIATTYNTNIFSGDVVELHTDGTITIGAAGQTNLIGIFNGCFYTDSDGKPNYSKYWPASTTSTDAKAFVITDPNVVFEAQEDSTEIGSTATHPAQVGSNADFVSTHAGTTAAGRSKQELDSSTITNAAANLRIIGKSTDPDNSDATTANCNWYVRFNEHLHYDNVAGI